MQWLNNKSCWVVILILLVCYSIRIYDADFESCSHNWLSISVSTLMLQGYDLYSELYYHQHPYFPLSLYYLFGVTGPNFQVALLFSIIVTFISSIPVFLSKGKWIGTFYLLSLPVVSGALQVANYSYMLAFFTWSWYLRDRKPLIAGLLLGISSGYKSYTLFFLPLFLYFGRDRFKFFAAYCLATLPIFYYAFRDWGAFYKNTYLVHYYYGKWCEISKPEYGFIQKVKFLFHSTHNLLYFLPFFFIRKINKEFFCALYSMVILWILLTMFYEYYFSIPMFFLFMASDRIEQKYYVCPILVFVLINYVTLNLSSTHNVKGFITFDWPVLKTEMPEFTYKNEGGASKKQFNLFYDP